MASEVSIIIRFNGPEPDEFDVRNLLEDTFEDCDVVEYTPDDSWVYDEENN